MNIKKNIVIFGIMAIIFLGVFNNNFNNVKDVKAIGNGSLNISYSWKGNGDYITKGVGLIGKNAESIELYEIPSGAIIELALIYWGCTIGLGVDSNLVFNYTNINGTLIGQDGPWRMFRSNITSMIIGNGNYTIKGLNAYGLSIIIIFSHPNLPYMTLKIADGADDNGNSGATGWMDPVLFQGFTVPQYFKAKLTFIIGDGQIWDNAVNYNPRDRYSFNGNIIAVNEADGSDGGRWDTDSYDVSAYINFSDTSATANVEESNLKGDELGWEVVIFSISNVTDAKIDLDPDTLNLKSKGKWITCYIELPNGTDVRDINASTILLENSIPPVLDQKYGYVKSEDSYIMDHDGDGIQERMVKFNRYDVEELLKLPGYYTLEVIGKLKNGLTFKGTDTIRVISKGK